MVRPLKKHPGGRPTVMTPKAVQQLEEAFALGCTDGEACLYAGISKSTFFNYQRENPKFLDKKELLKQRPVLLARQSVIDGLEGNPELALKFLERKRRDEFGPPSATQAAIQINISDEHHRAILAGEQMKVIEEKFEGS